ncbi:hypothetical protein QTH90_17565 [Variovorax sp. J2P1-59]|uniref:hypothetical protein n=1 Tax=Variovorax flavidus TaxID=3053501 RepID=UPI002576B3F3|nr:hypothetical protein [Variovorax sp. J2P1-59]MDM0076220.1 hypothetical protein [Variovorax sp. J2P1-59]
MRTWARLALLAGLAAALAPVHAESKFVSGDSGTLSATARLDLVVTIPRILYLRVGAGTDYTTSNSPDLISFTVPAGSIGKGVPVAGVGGDLTGGAVTVRVMGNGGDITLNSSTVGPLNNGTASQQIDWNQITVASTALATTTPNFNNGSITHPTFNATGGAGSSVLLPSTNKMVRQEGKWTYGYANTKVAAAGTYGGVGINHGRVTYTATMP